MHFHADITTLLVAHVTLPTVKMIFDCDPISHIERSCSTRFHYAADCLMTRYKWHAVIIVEDKLTFILVYTYRNFTFAVSFHFQTLMSEPQIDTQITFI